MQCHFFRILITSILENPSCKQVYAFDIVVVCKRYNLNISTGQLTISGIACQTYHRRRAIQTRILLIITGAKIFVLRGDYKLIMINGMYC